MKTRSRVPMTVNEPYRNLLAPGQGRIHRAVEVARVAVSSNQYTRFRNHCVVLVERHARAEDINERKAGKC